MEQYLYKRHIKGIQHIGIPTDKYSETLDFYKSLGFEDINQEEIKGKKQLSFGYTMLCLKFTNVKSP